MNDEQKQPLRDSGETDKEESLILAKIRKLRKEHKEASEDMKQRLMRREENMKDLASRIEKLEGKSKESEDRVSSTEDSGMLHESAKYLLHKEAKLAEKCSDFESRARRKNLRHLWGDRGKIKE